MNEELAEVTETTEPETTRDIIAAEFDKLDPVEGTVTEPSETVEQKETVSLDFSQLGFKKDLIPTLETLPDEVKSALAERDSSYKQGLEKYKQKAYIADEFTRALEPNSEYLTALGVSPTDYIPQLVNVEKTLRLGNDQQKIEMLHRLAHDYGIDLNNAAQTPFDPKQAYLQAQIEQRDAELRRIQNQSQNAEFEQLNKVIEDWSVDKPFFAEVRQDMALLLETGKAKDLDHAYQMATRLNDDVFKQLQEKQFSEKKKAEALKANQLAKQAKASAVQLSGHSAGSTNTPELKTTQDAVRWAMSQHGI